MKKILLSAFAIATSQFVSGQEDLPGNTQLPSSSEEIKKLASLEKESYEHTDSPNET